ncbi:hypothetical protein KXS12_24965 [Priestia filamentosa]|uniref:hypothetical protein n=1 Tax=Priestia filamentosa TaxID=1402861 RepID=UPI003F135ED1
MKWVGPIPFIIINIALFPLALLIGVFATDSPDSTILSFLFGMAFILGPPNLLFLIIYLGIKGANKESTFVPNND